MDARISLLVGLVDSNFAGRGWQGATLLGSLRGVSATEATYRPANSLHCIWNYILHAAYWKYAVHRRLGSGAPDFPRAPANWPALPEPTLRNLRRDVALLKEQHERLRDTVAAFPPSRLDRVPEGARRWTAAQLIYGVAAHDAYHTGQVQMLKRLARA